MKLTERSGVEKFFKSVLKACKRGDLDIEVGFLVRVYKPGGTEDECANLIIDPYQDMPKYKAQELVEKVSKKIDKARAGTEVKAAESKPATVGAAVKKVLDDTYVPGGYKYSSYPPYGCVDVTGSEDYFD